MLGIDHAALCVVLVDHVFLGQLQVQILSSALFLVENGWINFHAFFVFAGFLFVFFLLFLLHCF